MQTRIEESIERVRAWVRRTGQKQATVAKRATLSPGTLRDMFMDGWNPRATTLWAVENLIRSVSVPHHPEEQTHGANPEETAGER